ncbi:MAG: metallophosphoesterase [Gemmatirosa sp.]
MSYLFVLAISAALTLIVGVSLLASARVMRSRPALAAFWSVAAAIHILWWRLPDLGGAWSTAARWLVSAWLGTLVTAALLVIPLALLLVVCRIAGGRAELEARAPLVAVGISLAVGVAVSLDGLGDPVVREEVVRVRGLPLTLDGMRIANLGDVHVGRFVVPADLARAVDLVDTRGVDLLAVTGDLIDDLGLIEPTLDALERGRTRPVLAILGNHDKAHESVVVTAVRRRAPRLTLLVDGSVVIPHRGGRVRVVGADYPLDARGGHVLPRPQQDAAMREFAARAFAGATPGETIIALSHHPEFFRIAAARGAVLTLASHTHGGHVRFRGRPLIAPYDYMHGPHRRGDAHLDVSAGVGHWLPLRIGVPREIVIVTLRR